MESATLTRLRSGSVWLVGLRAVPASTWAKLGLGLICVGALVGFFVYPTYPTYDSYYALIWGRDIIHLHLPDFRVYRAPTEHPLAIAFGAAMALFGHIGDRLMILGAIGSFVALLAGLYRLGRLAFGPVVGALAVALLLTRFDYDYLAAQGYLDFSYMALVVWAGALEVARPRRGTVVFVLLALAGLLRPEGWLLSGVYFLWCSWRADWPTRVRYAVLTLAAPLLWAGMDAAVTGDPTFSLHSTQGLAEDLGRTKGIGTLPGSTWSFLVRLDKLPLVLGAIGGGVVAFILVPRRAVVPFVLLVSGILAFVLIGVSGASVIDRYLLTPAVLVMLFGAVAIGGWSLLEPGSWLRRAWIVIAIALVVYGVASASRTLSVSGIRYQLAFRNDTHLALAQVLDDPRVRHDLAHCGPLSLPNHKLIPDSRWILGAPPREVVARSQARADRAKGSFTLSHRIAHGVALYPLGDAVFTQAVVDLDDNPLDEVPLAGFTRLFSDQYYAVYVNCT